VHQGTGAHLAYSILQAPSFKACVANPLELRKGRNSGKGSAVEPNRRLDVWIFINCGNVWPDGETSCLRT
jgi:hypothetical protein